MITFMPGKIVIVIGPFVFVLKVKLSRKAVRLKFIQRHKEIKMLKLTDTQKSTVSIQPVDAKGNKADVEGAPVWSASVDGVVDLAVAADGFSCVINAVAPGTCQVNVTADADLGSGVDTISGVLDIEVVGGKAVGFTINTGAPEEQ